MVAKYKKIPALCGVMASGTYAYAEFFVEAGLGVPLPAVVFQACVDALSGEGPCVSIQQAEAAEAFEHEVWVQERREKVVHLKVHRKTEEIVEVPADLLERQCQPYVYERPGFQEFLGDLVTVFDFTKDRLCQWSSDVNYDSVKPTPYNHHQLSVFMIARGETIHEVSPPNTPARTVISNLVQRVGALSLQQYLELSTEFYNTVHHWEFFKSKIPSKIPIHQIGRCTVGGEPFFKYHAAARLDKERINYYLCRSSQWKVTAFPPTSTRDAVTKLGNSRAHRREGKGGYSDHTRGHREGGHLPDIRVDVTRVLGLVLPFLKKETRVDIRATNVEVVKHLHNYFVEKSLSALVKFILPEAEAVNVFKVEHYKKFSASVRTSEVMFLDMQSMPIPSFPSHCDADKVWEDSFLVPEEPYIAYRKAPPSMVGKKGIHFYRLGSAHAFDCVVSSVPGLTYAGRTVTVEDARLVFAEEEVPLEEFKFLKQFLSCQFADDRRKLELFISIQVPVKFFSYLNLWSPPQFFNKQSRHRVVMQVELEGPDIPMVSFDFADPGPLQQGQQDLRDRPIDLPAEEDSDEEVEFLANFN